MEDDDQIWQDREIRFDIPTHTLQPRKGETEIDSINSVEDTKGTVCIFSSQFFDICIIDNFLVVKATMANADLW